MNFNTIWGYKVKREKILELAKKYKLNTNMSYLLSVERFIQRSGFPVDGFKLIRQEDMNEADRGYFVLALHNSTKKKEEVNTQEILGKFHPRFFKLLKEDLDAEGDPQFYLAEP